MKPKKYSSLFVVVTLSAVVLAGCSMPTSSTSTTPAPNTESSPSSTDSATTEDADGAAALLTNTTVVVPGTNFTVVLNKPGVPIAYGENSTDVEGETGTITLGSRALKLGNNIVSTFTVNRGGTDRDLYIALFRNGANGWEMTRSRSIGKNIDLVNIELSRNGVTVNYLERGPDQAPNEAPNVPASKTYSILNGEFEEADQ